MDPVWIAWSTTQFTLFRCRLRFLPALRDSECPFGPLVAALFVLLVLSGNVFVTRGKPSASRAETSPTRDSSVVLEGLAPSLGS